MVWNRPKACSPLPYRFGVTSTEDRLRAMSLDGWLTVEQHRRWKGRVWHVEMELVVGREVIHMEHEDADRATALAALLKKSEDRRLA